jgi:tetratricopeptide (TPR) repeat protein
MTPGVRVAASAAALAVLWVALPVTLPVTPGGSSSEACLTLADRPPTGPEALPQLEQCAALVPEDVELLADLGGAYEAARRPEDAERVYRHVLALDADYADVHVRVAALLVARGAAAAARPHLEAALQLQPNRQAILDLLAALPPRAAR